MKIRKIKNEDNLQLKMIITSVMTELGANGEGFSIHDSELNDLYSAYSDLRSIYYVISDKNFIFGGAGINILEGANNNICELKKMYFLPEIRGKGFGKELIHICLKFAKEQSYEYCYIETLDSMKSAYNLYMKSGFVPLNESMGNTGHFGCNRWLLKKL